jgi:hypothetical protein
VARTRSSQAGIGCLAASLIAAGCGGAADHASAIGVTAAQWPQADVLFHRDRRWLGSDGAYSVALPGGRILWLFGDTLVAPSAPYVRTHAYFVRNTLAIERGSDPRTAAVRFYWGKHGQQDASFFAEQGSHWFWPADGIQVGRTLVAFLDRVTTNPRGQPGWNFEGAGWRLAVVADDSASPATWQIRMVTPPRLLPGIDPGAALARVGHYIVSLAIPEHGGLSAPGYLVRWPAGDLAAGRLGAAQWWAGRRGWVRRGKPVAIIRSADDGDSLTFDRKLGRWIFVRSEGFGATTIVVAFARRIEGPWSKQRIVYRPPESNRPNPNVYGAKGHPELHGSDLVVTYSTNTYPRFVKLDFARR